MAEQHRKPRPLPRPRLSEALLLVPVVAVQGGQLRSLYVNGDLVHRLAPRFAGLLGKFTRFTRDPARRNPRSPRRAGLSEHVCNARLHVWPGAHRMNLGSVSL